MTVHQKLNATACGCDARDLVAGLASVQDALDHALKIAEPVRGFESVALDLACGRVLATDIRATGMMPPFDNSGMDGYAVRLADFAGEGPWVLPVAGRIAAGEAEAKPLRDGTAWRIFTGARIPDGADAVVMQEEVVALDGFASFRRSPARGQNIRRAGEDMADDEVVMQAGQRLGPRDIAIVAGAGFRAVTVHPQPRVALLCTGAELVTEEHALSPGKIHDVNGPMLVSALKAAGGRIVWSGQCDDSPGALTMTLARLAAISDMIVTTGGVSVGEEDHVKAAVQSAGGRVSLSGVAMKPGKPVSFGKIGSAVYLGLPGNPVSAFVTWTLFGTTMLEALGGVKHRKEVARYVVSDQPVFHKPGRCEYRPARLIGQDGLGREMVSTDRQVHSARLGPLADCDGLILIPGDVEAANPGDLLQFLPFQR